MNTFAYAGTLLAKTQTAFKLANAAGVEIPPELTTVISRLQSVCDSAEGFQVPDTSSAFLSDAEALITSTLAKDILPNNAFGIAIGDAISLVKNKNDFSVTYHTPTVAEPLPAVNVNRDLPADAGPELEPQHSY